MIAIEGSQIHSCNSYLARRESTPRRLEAREKSFGRPLSHTYTSASLRCSLLSLARALWRIVGARQGSSQHGRPPAVAAGGLVPSQTYKDLVACADNTAVFCTLKQILDVESGRFQRRIIHRIQHFFAFDFILFHFISWLLRTALGENSVPST